MRLTIFRNYYIYSLFCNVFVHIFSQLFTIFDDIFTLMIYQWGSDNRSVTHFASIVGLMLLIVGLMLLIVGICFKFWKLWISGGYSWVPVGIGGYQWAPVDIGGYRWLLVESKYYIVTNLDCYELRLLQT